MVIKGGNSKCKTKSNKYKYDASFLPFAKDTLKDHQQ